MGGDTIAAVSTGAAAGGIGIVRISGARAVNIVDEIFSRGGNWKSHTLRHGYIVNEKGVRIDEALVSVMLAPKTYTKEDIAEINCHGGVSVVRAVLAEVLRHGARLAEPGEFTKRAFLNGRVDLSEAEAVMDLISAKTESSRKAALARLGGGLFEKVKNFRGRVLSMLAHIDASIDYPEHELEEINLSEIKNECSALISEIETLSASAGKGKILREGLNVVILGRPNVGKSMLLNAILGEERAIVTDIAGTTRDAIEEAADIGIPLIITDTAGVRDTEDTIEKIGVGKSLSRAENAELILLVLDASEELTEEDERLLEFIQGRKAIVLLNKMDKETTPPPYGGTPPKEGNIPLLRRGARRAGWLLVSAKEKTGLDELYARIKEMFFGGEFADSADEILISSLRQKEALDSAAASLREVISAIDGGFGEDICAIDLQAAYVSLGEITGESLGEDVIDKIFSEFCLGK